MIRRALPYATDYKAFSLDLMDIGCADDFALSTSPPLLPYFGFGTIYDRATPY